MKFAITPCILLIIVTLEVACGNQATPECKAKVSRLKQNLITYDKLAGSFDGYGTDMDLPISDIPPQGFLPKGMMLAFYENGRIVLDGIDIFSTQTKHSAALERQISQKIASGNVQLRLFVERELAVAPILSALPEVAKRADLALVVIPLYAPPPPPVPPGAAEYERRRRNVHQVEWVKLLTAELHKHGRPCRPLYDALSFSVVRPTDRGKHLIAKATDALTECGCHVADIDALEYIILAMLGAHAPRRRILPFTLSNTTDATLVLTPSTTAQELADILKASTPSKGTISVRFVTKSSI